MELQYVYLFYLRVYSFMELVLQVSRQSPDWDLELRSNSGSPTRDSHAGSPGFDDHDANEPSKPSAELTASAIKGQKRKTISDMVRDESEHIRVTRIKIAEVQAKEKTAREKLKRQTLANIELQRLKFQREEGEKQRAHEVMMMDRQIELERLRAMVGGLIPPPIQNSQIDPSLGG